MIELVCRACQQPYTPSRAELVQGPVIYKTCPACRAANDPPRVPVTVVAGSENWLLVFACPWCPPLRGAPRTHIHGGGSLHEPPLFGHRVSHCHAEGAPDGYELVETPDTTELPYGCPGDCEVETAQGVSRCSGCQPDEGRRRTTKGS